MGFSCALAIVLPTPTTELKDFHPTESEASVSDDIFFSNHTVKNIPGRAWEVMRFIDFGRVRTLIKPSSSLSVSQRAGDDFISRAAICAASFLLDHLYELERKVQLGSVEYSVPFIADHLLFCSYSHSHDDFLTKNHYEDVFAYLGTSDVVTGLWSYQENLYSRYPDGEQLAVVNSVFWNYNQALLNTGSMAAFFQEHYSLLWDSAYSLSGVLTELLEDGAISGEELRKDARSVAIVTTWRDTLQVLSKEGARCIFLTDAYHSEATTSIRSMRRYL